MNIFTKPLDSVTFEEVEAYCAEGNLETAELDYKKALPRDGLAKHIAAMSNTMGGIVIIGVEEDATGRPAKWEGVPNAGKLVDQIYQQAANVKPYPSCYVYPTTEKDGHVFILVQVLEGNAGPYYTVRDPHTVWMRTGNVSTPLKPADQDATERIRNRRDKADAAKSKNEAFAQQMRRTLLDQANQRRAKLFRSNPEQYKYLSEPLDKYAAELELVLQPYYPTPDLLGIKPAEMQRHLLGFRGNHGHAHFPDTETNPAPGGAVAFRERNGYRCDQFYTSGLIYHSHDVLVPKMQAQPPTIYLSHILMEAYEFLAVAQRFYASFNYHGLLVGSVRLANAQGTYMELIVPPGHLFFREVEGHTALLDDYEWKLDLDTHKLNDSEWLLTSVLDLVEKATWDLGRYTRYSAEGAKQFLQQVGFLPVANT